MDILVVTSKVKKFIKDNYALRTSADAADALTKIVEAACKKAAANAVSKNRKTVQAEDFE